MFSERLKQLRKDNNISQQQLAKELNVTNPTISRWENEINEPDLQIVKQIAEHFNVSIDWLLGFDSKEEEKDYIRILKSQGLNDAEIEAIIAIYETFLNSKKKIEIIRRKDLAK